MINESNIPDQFGSNVSSWSQDGDTWDDANDSYIQYSKETKNTLYSSGEYLILANSQPYIDVLKITGISEKLSDSGSGTILKKEFSLITS